MNTRARLIAVALPIVVIDRITKIWAENNLQFAQPREVVGTLLQFNLVYNPGAAFSIFTDATWVFTIFAISFVLFVLIFATRIQTTGWKIAAGLGLGGALGNLVDRLINEPGIGQGHVVDFLMIPNWPIFNIADASMSIAVAIIVIASLRGIDYK